MNVMSLFDGMSCGQIALNQLGIKINKYYAAEIDENAIKITKNNYPNTIHLGSVTDWKSWDIDWGSIDLIQAGSPCQGFSMAGKKLNFNDERSKLFFVFIDILNHIKSINPNIKFLLENVKMRSDCSDIISRFLAIPPREINSDKFTAQNRKRLYWFNWDMREIIDKNIYFHDVIDWSSDRWFNILPWSLTIWGTKRKIDTLRTCKSKKSFTLTTNKTHCRNYYLNEDRSLMTKLTAAEAEILQGVPRGYTDFVSEGSRYKALGNGWTVPVIKHIYSSIHDPLKKRNIDAKIDQLEFKF